MSVAGIHLASQQPFVMESDTSLRVIPGDAATAELRVSHEHYDHTAADRDPNIMFPLDRARELAAAGVIAGVNDKHYSLGYAQDLRTIYDHTAPDVAEALYQSQTDVVLLTAG